MTFYFCDELFVSFQVTTENHKCNIKPIYLCRRKILCMYKYRNETKDNRGTLNQKHSKNSNQLPVKLKFKTMSSVYKPNNSSRGITRWAYQEWIDEYWFCAIWHKMSFSTYLSKEPTSCRYCYIKHQYQYSHKQPKFAGLLLGLNYEQNRTGGGLNYGLF